MSWYLIVVLICIFLVISDEHLFMCVFVAMVNGIVSLTSFSAFSLLVYRNARNFCAFLCILPLYQIQWLAMVVFWWQLSNFLRIISCHLQTVTVLLLLFQFGFLLLLFLLWLLWLGLPKLCWIMARVDILVLFFILEDMLSVFHHREWCFLWVCCLCPLLC